jgi:hypothetical protein
MAAHHKWGRLSPSVVVMVMAVHPSLAAQRRGEVRSIAIRHDMSTYFATRGGWARRHTAMRFIGRTVEHGGGTLSQSDNSLVG